MSLYALRQVYSLFPALAADLYGTTHVSANYGCLYTGKAVASLLAGPVASSVVSTAAAIAHEYSMSFIVRCAQSE